jgi:hypothetical protein
MTTIRKMVRINHRKIKTNKDQKILVGEPCRFEKTRPNIGHKVKRPEWHSAAPTRAYKKLIRDFLRSDLVQDERTMNCLQQLLTGIVYNSKWFYREMIPYIRLKKGWIQIYKRISFRTIRLVLRQLMYVPSSLDIDFFQWMECTLSARARV